MVSSVPIHTSRYTQPLIIVFCAPTSNTIHSRYDIQASNRHQVTKTVKKAAKKVHQRIKSVGKHIYATITIISFPSLNHQTPMGKASPKVRTDRSCAHYGNIIEPSKFLPRGHECCYGATVDLGLPKKHCSMRL